MLVRLASASFRRRRRTILLWIVAVVALSLAAPAIADDFADGGRLPGTDSDRAYQLLDEHFPDAEGESVTAVFQAPGGVDTPTARAAIERYLTQASGLEHVAAVTSPFEDRARVSDDGTIAYATIDVAPGADDAAFEKSASQLQERAGPGSALAEAGVRTGLDGDWYWEDEVPASEAIGLLVAAVVLLISFGSVVAMGLPLITALIGVAVALAGVSIWTALVPTPEFTPQVAIMMGLGVGIDYALFIITRYRSELVHRPSAEALAATMATAGRAVTFAGCTVIVSMLGVLLTGLEFLEGLALGTSSAVLVAVAAAVTLLPALLSYATPRLARSAKRHESRLARRGETAWHRWGRLVGRRPGVVAAAGLIVLLALAAPVAAIRLATETAAANPEGSTVRTAYDLMAEGFGDGTNGPLAVVARDDAGLDPSELTALETAIAADRAVAQVAPAQLSESGMAAVVEVVPTGAPDSAATESLVHRLRNDVIPATGVEAHVGGSTASDVDFTRLMADRLPIVIGAVLAVSFLLLLVVFRSVLVPLKAVIMNLLSIGAAYGLMVAVFQWGWGAGLLGVETGPIASWVPLLTFAIVFGLSMDYEVFLLSAVRERFDRTGDNGEAVVEGLSSTARVITAAATIMVAVFGAFVMADLRAIKLIGFGLAAAVLIDATVVRMVLVPATMELLGARNWWLPRWLERILPRVSVEAHLPEPGPAPVLPPPPPQVPERLSA